MTGSTLGNIAGTAVHGATQVARHTLRTAAWAAGVVRGAAEAGVAAARDARSEHQRGHGAGESDQRHASPSEQRVETAPPAGTHEAPEDPRDRIPGPDVVAPAVPRAEDLPEPVVIVADDAPGEEVHHEPKAAGRESEHEGRPGDREEAEGYREEVVDTATPEVDVETPVGTTGADVATNPATAESDLQQPGTPPLGDSATIAAAVSESETLRRAAERDPES